MSSTNYNIQRRLSQFHRTEHARSVLIADRTFTSIVNSTTKRNYRADLRKDAVARASAIRHSQRPVKADKTTKTRGAKAKAAAASE
jgi:hypothetical protein